MKKVLIVKISSMGDLIQMLPALTDATRVFPGIKFDWVAEETFAEIPRLHFSVDKIIQIAHRRWKKQFFKTLAQGEFKSFYHQLRQEKYDYIIDAQSNLKSAMTTLLARGLKIGLDDQSIHEYGAHLVYHKKLSIARKQNHAIRMRQLFAEVFDYPIPSTPADYGIDKNCLPKLTFTLPEKFIFVNHTTSREHKHWPESFWQTVIANIIEQDYAVILPWWSAVEKSRAERLATISNKVQLLPPMNLTEKISVIAQASAAVSCDTGLGHIAAALNIPNVVLYGPTDPNLVGTIGHQQIHLTAQQPPCAPCNRSQCTYRGPVEQFPACMSVIKPNQVLAALWNLLNVNAQ